MSLCAGCRRWQTFFYGQGIDCQDSDCKKIFCLKCAAQGKGITKCEKCDDYYCDEHYSNHRVQCDEVKESDEGDEEEGEEMEFNSWKEDVDDDIKKVKTTLIIDTDNLSDYDYSRDHQKIVTYIENKGFEYIKDDGSVYYFRRRN